MWTLPRPDWPLSASTDWRRSSFARLQRRMQRAAAPAPEQGLEVSGLTHSFGSRRVVDEVSLAIRP